MEALRAQVAALQAENEVLQRELDDMRQQVRYLHFRRRAEELDLVEEFKAMLLAMEEAERNARNGRGSGGA